MTDGKEHKRVLDPTGAAVPFNGARFRNIPGQLALAPEPEVDPEE